MFLLLILFNENIINIITWLLKESVNMSDSVTWISNGSNWHTIGDTLDIVKEYNIAELNVNIKNLSDINNYLTFLNHYSTGVPMAVPLQKTHDKKEFNYG